MTLLDIFPLLSTFVGIVLCVFILFKSSGLGANKKIRYVLTALVFLYTFIAFDYYLILDSGEESSYYGMSYMFYHFIGILFYYFILLFIRDRVLIKKWVLLVIGYTILRWSFFYPLIQYDTLAEFLKFVSESNYLIYLNLEYYLVSLLNIILMFLAFFQLKKMPMVIKLDNKQELQYKWVKFAFVAFIILQIGTILNDIISEFTIEDYQAYLKFETLLITLFFFVFAYSMMHFPVFAITGNFEDLPKSTQQKYAKSSLTDSDVLFNSIHQLVENERLYLDYNLKLNTLAEKLDKSVHHISQAINQSSGKNFPDFINGFRIEEAKKRLLLPKPDTIYAISLDVGFNSKAAFYTAFKKATQLTPSEFKKRYKTSSITSK